MILAEYYQDVYLLIITIMLIVVCNKYMYFSSTEWDNRQNIQNYSGWIFTILIALFVGLRPRSIVFADMGGYINAVDYGYYSNVEYSWDNNYVFSAMMFCLHKIGISGETGIIIIDLIYFGAASIALRKIFPKDHLLAMLVFCSAFITFTNATNGMKAGCATALFLCAVAYQEKRIISILFLFLSLGFHHAAQLLVAAYVVCVFYKNKKFYQIFWLACLVLAIFHVTYFQTLFGGMTDEHGAGYLLEFAGEGNSNFGGKLGFRYDFVIYSVVPIIVGYKAIKEKLIESQHYEFMLNVYTLVNAIWMLCMYMPYTNRMAALGWGLYSMLILYPAIYAEWSYGKNKVLQITVFAHLGFTLFMNVFYY